jgi:serine protease Do
VQSAEHLSAGSRRSGGPASALFHQAQAAVVKLYGAAAGREHGYGTGVLISPDGQILTTLSLLVTTPNIRVVLSDGRRFDGRLIRQDDYRQLALLQIEAEGLPHLTPVESSGLEIGDALLALNNCFRIAEGEEPVSLHRGILSLRTNLDARRLAREFEYTGPVLIYDALTANPGAAGGPVLDRKGRFIGLVGKVVESAGTNTRLNYALPGEELLAFLGQRPAFSAAAPPASAPAGARPYVGIKLSSLGYHHVPAFIERVRPGSPAERAGLRADDLVVAIDSQRIGDAEACRRIIDEALPGQTLQFTIKRGREVRTLPVIVEAGP